MKNLLLILCLSCVSWAKQTRYLSFDEPPGWSCDLSSQGVFICESPNEQQRQDSVILFFGAPATDFDSLPNYERYLNKTKTIMDESGKSVESKVTFVRKRNINGFEWIDSLQQNSELPGYWTRYVATVQKPLAILVTYVVSEQRYTELTPAFERMVASLKPVTDFKFSQNQGDLALPGTELGGILKSHLEKRSQKKPVPPPEAPKPSGSSSSLIYLLGAVLILGLIWLLSKKQKKSS
ncbi:LPXTG cell wall anchor domain-containing protein [bacterium]|nr:LPXTG cell wall anchor domain-containing protein [bacterium]